MYIHSTGSLRSLLSVAFETVSSVDRIDDGPYLVLSGKTVVVVVVIVVVVVVVVVFHRELPLSMPSCLTESSRRSMK